MADGTTFQRFRGYVAAARGMVLGTDSTAPTITTGSAAPSAAEPDGSLYMRSGGSHVGQIAYARVGGAWKPIGPTYGTSTGTGSQQTIAHGLGVTPRFVLVAPKSATSTPFPIVEGTHTSTNILLTLPTDAAYTWVAFP